MKTIVINIILTLAVGTALVVVVRQYAPAMWGTMEYFGLCLAVIGFILWTVARFQLGKSLTVSAQARQLVTAGIYSKIRNPIYVFGSSLIVGLILAVGRPILLLAFLIIIPLQIVRARKESAVLEAAFGEPYRAYRASTWF